MKNYDEFNAEGLFQGSYLEAEEMIEHPDKVEKLLKRLEKKLLGVPKLGGALAYIPKMGMLINSWIKKEYADIPIGTIAAIISALIYFVSPVDAISDIFPGIGLLDDAAVVGLVLHMISSDLDEYMEWRCNVGLDIKEPCFEK